MKIISIIHAFKRGGAETLVGVLSQEFCSLGHEHLIIALNGAHDRDAQNFESQLQQTGAETLCLEGVSRYDLLFSFAKLAKTVRAFDPDIIHVHVARGLLPLVALSTSAKIVYTHHNIRLSFPKALFFVFDRTVDQYVAIAPRCSEVLEANTNCPVALIYNCAGAPQGQPTHRRLREQITIASLGRISKQKNFEVLIKATAKIREELKRQGSDLRLQIGGDGPGLGELSEFVRSEGASEFVDLLGALDGPDQLLAEADLYANSSLWEGLPLSLIEAATAGLPIVATDVGDVREVVYDGENGFLVCSGSVDQMAERMLSVLTDSDMYSRMSSESRVIAKGFSVEECAKAHLKLYQQLRLNQNSFAE